MAPGVIRGVLAHEIENGGTGMANTDFKDVVRRTVEECWDT